MISRNVNLLNKSVTYLMLSESDVMIVFKKLRSKRFNGFEVLDDDDETETPAQHCEERNLRSDSRLSNMKQIIHFFGSGIHKTLMIDDSTMIPKKERNTDVPRDVNLDVSPKMRNLDVKNVDAENAHVISSILPTGKKKYPQRRCVYCRDYSVPRDTWYYCKACINTPALCKTTCFAKYHIIREPLETESKL